MLLKKRFMGLRIITMLTFVSDIYLFKRKSIVENGNICVPCVMLSRGMLTL